MKYSSEEIGKKIKDERLKLNWSHVAELAKEIKDLQAEIDKRGG